jgi:hypothetical protein
MVDCHDQSSSKPEFRNDAINGPKVHCHRNRALSQSRHVLLQAGNFFLWNRHNPLKSPDSDEGIQGNPNRFSLVFLGLAWFGLELFGRS